MKSYYKLLFLSVMLVAPMLGWGQISITSTGTAFTQNFDGMGSSATASLPSGWKVNSATAYSTGTTATTLAAGTSGTGALSGSSAGGTYNYANGVTASSTDRAVGFLTSGSFTSPRNIFVQITNNTGSAITALTISFDFEKYRSGTRAWTMNFFSGTDGITWTAQTPGDHSYAVDGANAVVNPPTSISKSVTISGLSIANGSSYYLRWAYTGTGGSSNSQGIGVDNFSVTAAGSSNSTSSDIIRNSTFSEPTNIAYTSYQETNLTSTSLEVARFDMRDGGGTADGDALGTTLSAITFSLSNWANVRRVALYDGTTEIAELAVSSGSLVFSSIAGLSAVDGNSKTFSLRASFNASVTDNQQIQFTIGSATADAAGSVFAAANAGGSASSISGDANRIEVIADRLGYFQQVSNSVQNGTMSPAVTVEAKDVNNNRDLDFVSVIRITSSGSLSGTNADVTAVAGLATFSNLIHTATGTGLTLNAERQSTLDWDITSAAFNITAPSASANSVIMAVASTESASISSLENTTSITSNLIGTQVWGFDLYDGNGSANDADLLPTNYTSITISNGGSNTVTSWVNTILDVQFFEGTSVTPIAGTITKNALSIVFTPSASISIPDGAASKKTIYMRLSLKNPIPSGSDAKKFHFQILNSGVTTESTSTSSQLASFTINSDNTKNIIAVVATELRFSGVPGAVAPNSNFTSTVNATDANGNIDAGSTASVTLSRFAGTGTLSSASGLTLSLVAGTKTWTDLQYNTEETFTIQAVATGLTNGESPTIICTSAMGTSLVEWNFPNSTDDQYSDAGIALNYVAGTPASCKQISTQGSAGSPTFSNAGIATRCATATGWDNGNGVKYWQVDLNSTGYTQLKLTSKQRSSGTGPKNWKIQYKLGAGGTWTDVSSGTISVADNWTTGVKTDLALPTACDNQASVYLRWVMTSNLQVTTGNVAAGGTSRIDDVKVTGVSGNALTTGGISGSPFCITSTMGISLTVPFTSSGTFNSGNIYTAQLSDENGSFGVPTTIGTLSSTSNSGNISANIPAGTLDGTLYRIRVLSSDPYIAGTDNAVNLIVALNTPDASNLSGSLGSLQATLNWINPAGCYDDVLIVGRSTSNIIPGTPTGDGSSYTANLSFGLGTACLGGKVVYKGNLSGQVVTTLKNDTTYFFKLFVRKGSSWSNGIEISVTPTTANNGDYQTRLGVSGDWSINTTWQKKVSGSWVDCSSGDYPNEAAPNVTIRTGSTVTLDNSPRSVHDLVVENGAKVYTTIVAGANRYISVYGNNLICNGIIGNGTTPDYICFNIEGTNVTISGTGNFDANRIRKDGITIATTNLIIAMNINLRFATNSGTQIYNNSNSTSVFNITVNSGSMVNLIATGTNTGNASINGTSGSGSGGGTWTINGTMNIPGILYATTNNTSPRPPCKWIIGNSGVVTCNYINCSASGSAGHEIEILDGGKLNLNTNNGFFNFSSTNNIYDFQDGSTVEYSSPSGTQTVKATIPGVFEYSNLLISTTGGAKQLAGDITVKRDLIITGGILEANGMNISVGRNWENFGTNGFTEGAVGTVYCNGATAQTLSCPGGEDFYNIDFSLAGTKTLLADINVASNLTINSASGSLIANTHNITLGGNWTNFGTAGFTEGAADVTFNGSNTQNLTCPGGENFYNLISNNTGGGINLLNNTSVFNQLSMNSGNILTNSNYLELGSSTSNLGILNYNTGYVVGKMRRWLNGLNSGYNSGLYPLGQDVSGSVKNRFYYIQYLQAPTAGGYLDINFNPVATGSDGIPINGIPAVGTCATFDVVFTAQQGYWIATPEAGKLGDGNYTLAITGEDFNIVTDICELTLLKRVGAGNWQTPGTHLLPTGTGSLPTVSRSDLVGFSNFGFGGGYSNPLPVELRSFTAECAESGVEIKWSTATETNNNYFTIEKSADAKQWMTVAKIDGAGNSNQILNYQYADKKNLGGPVYYRLKQTDYNGKTEIFTPTSVNCSATSSDVFIYPNPFNEMITIQIGTSNENTQLTVYDQLGMKVKETQFNSKETGSEIFDLDLSDLSRGVYFINILSGSFNKTEKIVKE